MYHIEVLQYHRGHKRDTYGYPYWHYGHMDLVQEALIIVNAAVKGSTYPYLDCTFPYTGLCGTVYGRT